MQASERGKNLCHSPARVNILCRFIQYSLALSWPSVAELIQEETLISDVSPLMNGQGLFEAVCEIQFKLIV